MSPARSSRRGFRQTLVLAVAIRGKDGRESLKPQASSCEDVYSTMRISAGFPVSCRSWISGPSATGAGDPPSVSSPIPSAMLEQEAHMFGLREKAPPLSDIGSPQQMQIRGLILLVFSSTREKLHIGRNPRSLDNGCP